MLKKWRISDDSKRYTKILLKKNEKNGKIIKLKNFDNLILEGHYGGAQEWYKTNYNKEKWNLKETEKVIRSSCGFVSAANAFAYDDYVNNGKRYSKEEFLKLMTQIYDKRGRVFFRFGLFESGLRKIIKNFSKYSGYKVVIKKSGIFENKSEFIKKNLAENKLIVLLFGWGKNLPFTEHWVTITEIYEIKDVISNKISDHIITVSSWGKKFYFRLSRIEKWIINRPISIQFLKNKSRR